MPDIAPLPPVTPEKPLPKVNPKQADTAKSFEAVFLGQMTQMMLESVEQDGEFSGGHGEEMFRGVLAEKLGTEIARRGGVGLAPVVLDQILKMQQGQ
ncbi:MAG: rod-binding protein [Sphingomonas sp.]|uniref:rod-binding protein n=1 Tax=Sphingomonas sp. TaxID=28214 RepID=UPI001B1DA387|nr:rod-binding protein [Sphingomonas sp.]MBO9623731.1 rod-binding protein [Sphingomonas sp.]